MLSIAEFGIGNIANIIKALKNHYNVNTVDSLPVGQKLDALCTILQFDYSQFDKLIANNPPVLRTIKGHAFEEAFDTFLRKSGYIVTEVGGDEAVDRIVNNHTLQLKTPTQSGTHGVSVQYKTHKTHSAKSEVESLDYYHLREEFADYLVGLISYSPLRIIFLRRDELPAHPKSANHIISPFTVKWENHPSLNAFHLIGVDSPTELIQSTLTPVPNEELLPLTANLLQLKTDIIVNTILHESNFRIWDMAIKGFAREVAFQYYLETFKTALYVPTSCRKTRGDKSDLALLSKTSQKPSFFQVKGVSINNCKFDGANSTVAVETQLTRGRVNNHPTQSRLYLRTDFDFLIISIEPCLTQIYMNETTISSPEFRWQFFSIPTRALARHHKFTNRLKSLQVFNYTDLLRYEITNKWVARWKSK